MRAVSVLGFLIVISSVVVAAEPGQPLAAAELQEESSVCESPGADAAPQLPMSPDEFAEWAVDQGFEVETRASVSGSENPPSCPPIISCNATHCVETEACQITDFGSTSCTGHVTLNCPLGTTIKIRRCRCIGGGCQVGNSQTFFCL